MRGILIDPTAKSVNEVDYTGDYKQIYKLCDFSVFDCFQIDPEHTLFVDDEGLLKDNNDFFRILGGSPHSFAGKGLILGLNDSGASVGSELSVEDIKKKVKFFEEGT
jgi:hypothetical protein|tara:strand:- start:773 stop:1093 length:321 start_codon:yes stop_codon:yes gene_type:complete